MRRLAGLDALRGMAVAAVVAYHLGLAPSGFLGVDVFFVLSGFLISTILLRELDATGTVQLLRFSRRRLLRLYPALVVLVLGVLVVSLGTRRAVGNTASDALVALTYTGDVLPLHGLLDHVWTLGLEEQFYLLWPALIVLSATKERQLRRWPGALLVGALLAADLVHGRVGYLHVFVRAMGLPLGCAIAISPTWRARLARGGPVCLLALLVVMVVPLPPTVSTGWPVSVGAVLATPCVAWLSQAAPRLLGSAPLQWLGTRSYSLYLWHFPLVSLALNHAPAAVPHAARVGLALVASLIAAEASYAWVERPVLRWRDRPAPATVAAV